MPLIPGYARQAQDLALFTRHLEGAMKAKAPLAEVVQSFSAEADTRSMQSAIRTVVPRLQAGASLSSALDEAPHIFPETYRRVIRMGEESQSLPGVTGGLATALEEGISLHESFRRAAVYPAIVIFILIFQVAYLSFLGTTKFSSIMNQLSMPSGTGVFETFQGGFVALPLLTLFLICFLWLIGAGAGLVWNSYRHGRLILSLPLVGPALRLSETARFVRHLGLMLENRIPLNEAIGLLSESSTNGYLRRALKDFQTRLEEGESLGSVIGSQPVFPESLSVMLTSAQERGNLSETLAHLADYYRERARHALRVVREFFEPLMLLVVGFLIAWVALSFYLPIFQIFKGIPNVYY